MRDLEDILRRESHRPLQEEEAPAGGFSDIHNRLAGGAVSARWSAWWALVPFMGVLLLTVFYVRTETGLIVDVATPPTETTNEFSIPTGEVKVEPEAPAVITQSLTPSEPPALVPPALPSAQRQGMSSAVIGKIDSTLKSMIGKGNATPPEGLPTEGVVVAQTMTFRSIPENERKRYVATTAEKDKESGFAVEDSEIRRGAVLGPQSPHSNLPGTRDRASFPAKLSTDLAGITSGLLVAPVLPTVINLPAEQTAVRPLKLIKPLRAGLKGWDLSISWNAILGEMSGNVFRLTDDPAQSNGPGNFATVIINGSPQRLYDVIAENYEDEPAYKKIEYTYLQMRLNRQMASGWRFGIGVVGLLERRNNEQLIRRVATEDNNPSLYYGVYKTENTYWIVQGETGYTFRLGKRWRPWLAASLNVGLQTRENYEASILHDGMLSRGLTTQSRSRGLSRTDSNVYMALSGGLQYRLTNRFSAGFNVGYIPGGREQAFPLPGLEVRVHF